MLLRATLKQLLRVAPELVTSRTKAPKKQASRPNTGDIGLCADFDEQADDDEPSLEMTAAATKASKALLVALVKLLEAYSLRPTPELLDLAMQVRFAKALGLAIVYLHKGVHQRATEGGSGALALAHSTNGFLPRPLRSSRPSRQT
jgi:hypothetical protein